MSVSELQAMAQDINATQVCSEQRLSDYVIITTAKKKCLNGQTDMWCAKANSLRTEKLSQIWC